MNPHDTHRPAPPVAKSATGVVAEALTNVTSLVRNEVNLARAEVSENLSRAAVAIGLLVAAIVFALISLNVLAAALVAGLTELGLEAGWAALIVGGLLGLIAFMLTAKGINDLKLSSIAPTRTVRKVQRVAAAVKESYDDK